MKVLVVSESLPPVLNGQGVGLYRMLCDKRPDEYCLASQINWRTGTGERGATLPGPYYHLEPPKQLNRGYRLGLSYVREAINMPLIVSQLAHQLVDIIKRERCDVVLGCTGDVADLPAALSASRRTGVPFFAYVFDHYVYREWRYPIRRWWARYFERKLMREAAGVIALNETLCDDLRERFGVEASLIHNSFDISRYTANGRPPTTADDGIKIVYTGDVYEAHYDAFRNLINAIESLNRPEIKLHLYTNRPLEELATYGIKIGRAHV